MKLRVLVADDEDLGRERLRQLLVKEPRVGIVDECGTGSEALQTIRHTRPELAFLDVKMPELDGFTVLRELEGERMPVVIFVTAHNQFAVQAFDVHAADFLLKPFDRERFQLAFDRAVDRIRFLEADAPALSAPVSQPTNLERLAVRSHGRISLISTKDIDWICAADNYVALHVAKTTHLVRGTLRDLEGRLSAQFIRISRSRLVNMERVKEIRCKSHGDSLVLLHDGTLLPSSRSHRRELRRLLTNSS